MTFFGAGHGIGPYGVPRRAVRTTVSDVRVDLLTREYPPDVYGGAGVHVENLVRGAAARSPTCGCAASATPRDEPGATGYPDLPSSPARTPRCGRSASTCTMAADCAGADLVHSHTWYANLAGHLAGLLHGVPHVRHRAQPRAAAPVEGRAARRRLRAVVVGRADRLRGRGRA